jgi:hypothetical protein
VLGGDRQVVEDVRKTQEWEGSTGGRGGGYQNMVWRSGGLAASLAVGLSQAPTHLAQPLFFLAKPVFELDISQL